MDTGGIGSGRIVYAVDEACQGIPQSDCQCGKPGCSTGVKRRFSAYLLSEENKDPKFRAIAWQSLLWAIWGPSSENGGSKVIKAAPEELREKYRQVFA